MFRSKAAFWLWLHNSEVILWARIQVLFGILSGFILIVWHVLSVSDVSPILKDPFWISVWAIGNGVITELLRRAGTIDQGGHLRDPVAALAVAEVATLKPEDISGSIITNKDAEK